MRQLQVLRLIAVSNSTLWRDEQWRTFPQPVKLSQRVTARRAADVRQWIDKKAAAS